MHTGDFNWTLIRSFLAALDHGSLMAAARALATSQPTVGRHIGELETQLGVVLFERTGRGLLPTAHALRLADAARAMSVAADQLARQASGAQADPRGSVRISASQPVTCVLLPPVLLQMRQALPDIQIELVSSNAVSNLLQREADIALRMVRPDQGSLVTRRVGQVAIGAYAHRDYLRRCGTPRVPEDLLTHDLVGYDRNTDIVQGFARMGYPIERERFAVRTDDLNAYQAAVDAGLGVGFLARYVARQNPDLVPLLPMLPIPPLPVWLAVHREIRSNPRIRAVWDFLARALPQALS
ncbi:LysR family transcriptional regulator [Hydrogenophaga taeniospiralis]|jgi:DNA-binding transcriptional LysR family regulator|uniref:LysR family transcriptional regulator n=1 Tax=Hydrogenophaga taeniospiralis TaxID=65656 RepID=UPI001CFB3E48|nr:LysR family transcriptional regulator [Hydrogenophaga taeniospiralis]MCB4362303.1 LysR family transcriptional regulator [Hydrogenophaga taeniospiralis]